MFFNRRDLLLGAAAIPAATMIPNLAQAQSVDMLKMFVPAAPGGGWDQTARTLEQVLRATHLVKGVQITNVGGYRADRRKELVALAKTTVEKVLKTGEPVKLEPMSAFERKCVHDVVTASDGVESESEGVEPNRRSVGRPA